MRAFTVAVRGAAIGLFMASCTGNPSTSSGSTTSSSSAGNTTSSSGAGGAGGSTAKDIIKSFCTAVAMPLCQADYACCTDWHFQYAFGDGIDTCVNHVGSSWAAFTFCNPSGSFDVDDLQANLEAGTTVFNQAQFDACLAELKALSAGGNACTMAPKRIGQTSCLNTFQGQIPPGGACSWNETVWPDTGLPCKDGNCENGVCVAFAKMGEQCTVDPYDHAVPTTMHCNTAKGEVCWGPPDGGGTGGAGGGPALGTCHPRAKIGEPCDPGNWWECESYLCDPATSKCAFPDVSHVCSAEY